ncbi:hypothetical protein [Halorubrum ezzemoulense]|nr:hypothetical protein [Halorubrum ezzemoulense]
MESADWREADEAGAVRGAVPCGAGLKRAAALAESQRRKHRRE